VFQRSKAVMLWPGRSNADLHPSSQCHHVELLPHNGVGKGPGQAHAAD
jgi:hypothetical protein